MVFKLAGLALSVMLLWQPAVRAQNADNADSLWQRLTAGWNAYIDGEQVVGSGLVLINDGRIAREHYTGWAYRAAERPADRGTIWHWGSITKTLTAVAVMQLVEREMLSLADPVTLHVPEAVRINNPHGSMDRITLRHLMSHTSGLQNGTWPWGRGREWEPFEPTEWAQLVAMMPYMQVGFEPGSRYGYSNPAFVYLARAIESVSGDPWQGYVYKNLFAPLELNASYFGNTPWHLTAQRSHNYTVAGEDVRDNGADFDPGITIPNGGWNAPASDLSRWMSFLAGSSDPVRQARYDAILTRASLEQMWQPVAPIDEGYGDGESMGMSFFVQHEGDRRLIGHTGTQANFRSFFWVDPENHTAIFGVVNTSSEAGGAAAQRGLDELAAAARRVLVFTRP